jgi:hypothetical protein
MYLLLIVLRAILGLLPRTPATHATWWKEMAASHRHPERAVRWAVPHQWMSMDYVLTESPSEFVYCGRGVFERVNHPLRSVFRLARLLAGGFEPCPALAATVSLGDRRIQRV